MTDVKCKVKSCHFWGPGDVCEADSIMVSNYVDDNSQMEIGDLDLNIGKNRGGQLASSSKNICKTFKPRDDKKRS